MSDEERWSRDAEFFESDASLKYLALSVPVSLEEQRQILGIGERKQISIRIPQNDLKEIKKIAKANKRKYQQLIVQAIESYINNYHMLIQNSVTSRKKIISRN